MDQLGRAVGEALGLLVTGDRATWAITLLSLQVSGLALGWSALGGIPLGAWLALARFRGRWLFAALVYTGMGLPPVVVGLVVYLLLSRSGPLGTLGWLFTPPAMVVAQTVISLPLVAGLTLSALEGVDSSLALQLRALGATSWQVALSLLWEVRTGLVVALLAGFGSIISEVGAVMLVGGNIEGRTRVLTTAIVVETRQGNFEQALALALVLLGLTFSLNLVALHLQHRLGRR